MKYIFTLILAMLISLNSYSQLQSQVIDKVVANVGGEYILLSDVEKQYAYLKTSQPEIDDSYKCDVIENIIASKIMVVQAKLDSVVVSDDEVEAQLDFRIQNILGQMGNNEEFFEDYYGQTVNEVKEWMREEMKQQILSERMQSQIINEVNIRPEEVVEFFENIHKDSLPLMPAEVELAEIVMKPEASQEAKDKSYELLLELRQQIVQDSADFAELATKHSDDVSSGSQGGELGWQKRGSFVPEFESAAYSLEEGEISEVVESEFGYHLIQQISRRGELFKTRHILIEPEITDADIERTRKFLDSLRVIIEADSMSFSAAVKQFSDENQESFNNNGRMTNPQSGSTFYSTNDLPPEIYFAIEELQVGEISAPIEFSNRRGETMFKIVELQSKSRPHIANLKEDYSRIRQFAIESKKNEYFNEWIMSKLNTTYMKVVPSYQTCPNISEWTKESAQ